MVDIQVQSENVYLCNDIDVKNSCQPKIVFPAKE